MKPGVEHDLVLLGDVARDCGCTPDAVVNMMKRHKKKIYKQNRRNAIRFEDVEWLTQHRERRCLSVAKRPAGWWGSKRVISELNVNANTLAAWQEAGDLSAVRVGNHYFYDPETVRACALRRERIIPGWVFVASFVKLAGSASALYRAVQHLKLDTRLYHDGLPGETRGRRRNLSIRLEDVPLLEARLTFPESYPERLTTQQLSELSGATPQAIRLWLMKGLPKVKDRYGHVWIDLHEALAWLESRSDSRYLPRIEAVRAALTQQQWAA